MWTPNVSSIGLQVWGKNLNIQKYGKIKVWLVQYFANYYSYTLFRINFIRNLYAVTVPFKHSSFGANMSIYHSTPLPLIPIVLRSRACFVRFSYIFFKKERLYLRSKLISKFAQTLKYVLLWMESLDFSILRMSWADGRKMKNTANLPSNPGVTQVTCTTITVNNKLTGRFVRSKTFILLWKTVISTRKKTDVHNTKYN